MDANLQVIPATVFRLIEKFRNGLGWDGAAAVEMVRIYADARL